MRLTKRFAEFIDGVDLSRRRAGEEIELPTHEARLLLAEGWAELASGPAAATSADKPPRRRLARPKRKGRVS